MPPGVWGLHRPGRLCLCVREAPHQDTGPGAAHSAALDLSLHPEKCWGVVEGVGLAHCQSPSKILVCRHPLPRSISTVLAACIDPPISVFVETVCLPPSINAVNDILGWGTSLSRVPPVFPTSCVGAPQTPLKQMGFGWPEGSGARHPAAIDCSLHRAHCTRNKQIVFQFLGFNGSIWTK